MWFFYLWEILSLIEIQYFYSMEVKILDFKPAYRTHFERLNKAWLEEFFVVEPIDQQVLENPEEAILKNGGAILFAEYGSEVIGTVALRWIEEGILEMTKMAVDTKFQGKGAGRLLCTAAIKKAKEMGVEKLILYSNTSLAAAIALYRKMGFVEIPLEEGVYKRSNIKMEKDLKE